VAAGCALVFVAGVVQAGPWVVTVGVYVALVAGGVVLVRRWSGRPGWSRRHVLALAAGGLGPHVGFSLVQRSLVDVPLAVDLAGDLVFGAAVVATVVVAWRSSAAALPDPRP
jgi:hypothetical protein